MGLPADCNGDLPWLQSLLFLVALREETWADSFLAWDGAWWASRVSSLVFSLLVVTIKWKSDRRSNKHQPLLQKKNKTNLDDGLPDPFVTDIVFTSIKVKLPRLFAKTGNWSRRGYEPESAWSWDSFTFALLAPFLTITKVNAASASASQIIRCAKTVNCVLFPA